jgi:hypothetical protein
MRDISKEKAIILLSAWFFRLYRKKPMAKYSKSAQRSVKRAMHEKKRGKLRSGRSGKKVTSRKQAIAIGLSEARKKGAKVPAPKRSRKAAKRTGRAAKKRGSSKNSKGRKKKSSRS